jgi:methyl-accepting chemotaxis protein
VVSHGVTGKNAVAYTTPYTDLRTGDTVISAVKNIDLEDGAIAGILVADIKINWLVKYVDSLSLAEGGYGMLLSQNMTFMAHPDNRYTSRQLHELGNAYSKIAFDLYSREKVFGRRITNTEGISDIVFFTRISNGWYIGIVTHYFDFYHDLYISSAILIAVGIILAAIYLFILHRLSQTREELQTFKEEHNLTSREQEVFTMLLDGTAPKEIGFALKISYPTINFHISNIYRKLGIQSRAELFAKYKN